MCGFAGIVAWEDRYRVDRETLRRMSARIAHRGPDGEGYFLNHEQEATPDRPQVGLAFRRLAILDPDPRAMQPFTTGDKTIVFNGEIYNFRELRAELSQLRPDYAWRTTGDTEVLLLAYDVWGEACVERLNGMFAFAVWNEGAKTLFLARDRMGQKPLYWATPDAANWNGFEPARAIAFASELSAFQPLHWINWNVRSQSVAAYLRWGYVPAPGTIYGGVGQLHAAAWMRVEQPLALAGQYFRPNHCRGGSPSMDAACRARKLVTGAVRRQLVSDVPLGCFLSGGVDSSVVAAAMKAAAAGGQAVLTFSIGFDDPRYDETQFAEAVAKHLGTRHQSFTVRPHAAEDLPKLAAVFGEPFGDSSALPTHYLSRETRRHVKVVLSGDGGDELFGGYDRYRAIAVSQKLEPLVPAFASERLGRLARGHPKSRMTRAGRFFQSLSLPLARRYGSYLRLFPDELIDQLTGEPSSLPLDVIERGFAEALEECARPAEAALAVDRLIYLPNDLLTKVDRASMLHALEVRSPFMDPDVVQFAAGLTTDQLLKGGPKRMLREAFAADLPAWVFKRRKMGFAVPIGDWFRGELRPMLRDHLFAADSFARGHFNVPVVERLVDEHESRRADHSQRLYALLMLELWWRTCGR